jgi:mRNA interferase MazF
MNEFDSWNEIKKKIDQNLKEINRFPKEGEVWMSAFGKNIGFEQSGSGDNFSRPVLIIKKFNNQMFWSLPLSTKQKRFDFYYNFSDPYDKRVSIIIAQIKLISIKRLNRKMYELPGSTLSEVKEKIRNFLT